jgi:hypothetical protein
MKTKQLPPFNRIFGTDASLNKLIADAEVHFGISLEGKKSAEIASDVLQARIDKVRYNPLSSLIPRPIQLELCALLADTDDRKRTIRTFFGENQPALDAVISAFVKDPRDSTLSACLFSSHFQKKYIQLCAGLWVRQNQPKLLDPERSGEVTRLVFDEAACSRLYEAIAHIAVDKIFRERSHSSELNFHSKTIDSIMKRDHLNLLSELLLPLLLFDNIPFSNILIIESGIIGTEEEKRRFNMAVQQRGRTDILLTPEHADNARYYLLYVLARGGVEAYCQDERENIALKRQTVCDHIFETYPKIHEEIAPAIEERENAISAIVERGARPYARNMSEGCRYPSLN